MKDPFDEEFFEDLLCVVALAFGGLLYTAMIYGVITSVINWVQFIKEF
jgi:hypothetical protein